MCSRPRHDETGDGRLTPTELAATFDEHAAAVETLSVRRSRVETLRRLLETCAERLRTRGWVDVDTLLELVCVVAGTVSTLQTTDRTGEVETLVLILLGVAEVPAGRHTAVDASSRRGRP